MSPFETSCDGGVDESDGNRFPDPYIKNEISQSIKIDTFGLAQTLLYLDFYSISVTINIARNWHDKV